jgi:hypothetical protein
VHIFLQKLFQIELSHCKSKRLQGIHGGSDVQVKCVKPVPQKRDNNSKYRQMTLWCEKWEMATSTKS